MSNQQRSQRPKYLFAVILFPFLVFQGCSSTGPESIFGIDEASTAEQRFAALTAQLQQLQSDDKNTAAVRSQIELLSVRFPRDSRILKLNAVLAYNDKDYQRSQSYLDSLLAIDPSDAEAASLRAQIALGVGNIRFAKKLLSDAIAKSPQSFSLHETYGAALFLARDYSSASNQLKLARALGAPEGRTLYHLGLIEEFRGQIDSAVGYYQKALMAEPPFAEADRRLAGLQAKAAVEAVAGMPSSLK